MPTTPETRRDWRAFAPIMALPIRDVHTLQRRISREEVSDPMRPRAMQSSRDKGGTSSSICTPVALKNAREGPRACCGTGPHVRRPMRGR